AKRGHRLLKDKLDMLVTEFVARIGELRRLRAEVEAELIAVYGLFSVARGERRGAELMQALLAGEPAELVHTSEKNVMGVTIPEFDVDELPAPGGYSLAMTPVVLDEALEGLVGTAPKLLELAQREKAIELLAAEIERTRRRVNALEHVLIPQLDEAVRGIRMKLDEAERDQLTRLMKVKEMVEGRAEEGTS
ncbi:unnamed protein product, partial [marine sediment metagenome]